MKYITRIGFAIQDRHLSSNVYCDKHIFRINQSKNIRQSTQNNLQKMPRSSLFFLQLSHCIVDYIVWKYMLCIGIFRDPVQCNNCTKNCDDRGILCRLFFVDWRQFLFWFTLKIYSSNYQIMRHRIIQFVQKGGQACKIFADGVAVNSREDRGGVRLFKIVSCSYFWVIHYSLTFFSLDLNAW